MGNLMIRSVLTSNGLCVRRCGKRILDLGYISLYSIIGSACIKGGIKVGINSFGQNAPAQNDLIFSQNSQNCTHTCTYTRVRALNVTLPDPLGSGIRAGQLKADRAIRK